MTSETRLFRALLEKVIAHELIALEHDSDYIRWAILALGNELDSPSLRQLASLMPDENHFVVLRLVSRALSELNLPVLTGKEAVLSSCRGNLELALLGEQEMLQTLDGMTWMSEEHPEAPELSKLAHLGASLRWIDEPDPSHIKLRNFEEAENLFREYAEEFLKEQKSYFSYAPTGAQV